VSASEDVTRPPPWALPLDTTLEAARVQAAILRRLGPERRARMAAEMSDGVREAARQAIRRRRPDYTDRQVHLAFCRLVLGDALFRQAFPDEQVEF
jgi:hypothetical protein